MAVASDHLEAVDPLKPFSEACRKELVHFETWAGRRQVLILIARQRWRWIDRRISNGAKPKATNGCFRAPNFGL